MPIIVDPSFVPPGPPTTATSSDSVVTATLDAAHAGVVLKASYTIGTTPIKVAFFRDGVPVRSGDLAWAPGGIAVAYDHEAPLGVASSWTAVPHFADGTTAAMSQPAVLTIPNPSGAQTAWLKSVIDPALSRTVWVETPPTMALAASTSISPALGSPFPVGSWDVRAAYTTSFALVTQTASERIALEALLDSGPLLYQCASTVDLPDFYLLPGDVSWEWVAGASDATRRWTVPATEIDRPSTLDAPLRIPGLSWASTVATYASWSTLTAAKSSWAALLGA